MNWMAQRIENKGALRVLYLLGPPRQAWQVTRNKQSQFHRGASSRGPTPWGTPIYRIGQSRTCGYRIEFHGKGISYRVWMSAPESFRRF
jgi:hypothetical protein